MKQRKYHADGSPANTNQVFVFGSNLSGIHGAGAAKAAREHYGAVLGVAEGHMGRCYAIPTVKHKIAGPLTLSVINRYVNQFIEYAKENPQLDFFVTRIGCGLAGHKDENIAPMFVHAPPNCSLPDTWQVFLEQAP